MSQANSAADRFLKGSGVFWYFVALCGQIAFVVFIIAFYGSRTASGDFAGWNDKPLLNGYTEGDGLGNFMFITHVLGATIISLGGMLQLVPLIRSKAPAVHRWLGRSFMVMAILMATGGLMMTWGRGPRPSELGAIAITIDGVLILLFAIIAWRLAVLKRIDQHRRWAMRAFMVANGVWFLRLLIMAWAIATNGWGMTSAFDGPADIALQFACYLLPLLVLEIYFLAQRSASPALKYAVTGLVVVSALVTGLGVFGAQSVMWGPTYL